MLLLTLLSTSGTIIVSVLLAILIWRDLKSQRLKTIAIALLICLAAAALMGFPSEWGGSHPLRLATRFVSMPLTGLAWWMVLCLLDDEFKLRKLAWTGMIATLLPAVIFWLEDAGYNNLVFTGSSYLNPVIFTLLLAHVIWIALSGLKDDLVRFRREVRLWLVVLLIASTTLSIVSGYILEGQSRHLTPILIIFLGLVAVFFRATRFQVSTFEFSKAASLASAERVLQKTAPPMKD